jgi:hypothetical protein
MRDSTRKELTLSSFLQTLNLAKLGLSEDFIKVTAQHYESTLESFGVIRQRLIEQKLSPEITTFDKLVERETIKIVPKEATLFPNEIPPETFAIPSKISDAQAQLLALGKDDLARCYEAKGITVYVNNKPVVFKNHDIEEGKCIGTCQEFVDAMGLWLDPRTLQHWCVLWNWCSQNKSFFLPYIPINEILATVYTRPKDGQFKMGERKAFSTSLDFFDHAEIEIPVIVEKTLPNGKKKKEEAIKHIRFLNLDLSRKNKKGDVYLKIAGTVLPGLDPGKYRGRIFPQGIFLLDANREGHRIPFAYRVCNRFDQMNGADLHWPMEDLMIAAGLEATYKQNRCEGCKKLTHNLERLIEVKCIGGFEPQKISTSLTKPVVLHALDF